MNCFEDISFLLVTAEYSKKGYGEEFVFGRPLSWWLGT